MRSCVPGYPWPATVPELIQQVGASRPAIQKHLTELQRAGVVAPDLPEDQWHGRKVHWRLKPERVREMVEVLQAYALPVSSQGQERSGVETPDLPQAPR